MVLEPGQTPGSPRLPPAQQPKPAASSYRPGARPRGSTSVARSSVSAPSAQAGTASSACAISLRLFSMPYSAMKLPMRGPCSAPSSVS